MATATQHGAALGPMEPVVRQLRAAPDDDVRAMAHYLASRNPRADAVDVAGIANASVDAVAVGSGRVGAVGVGTARVDAAGVRTSTSDAADVGTAGVDAAAVVARAAAAAPLPDANSRFFESACGACHHDGDGPRVFGVDVPLALGTKVHADRPDNLVRTIVDGVRSTPGPDVGFMPAFRDALDDAQLVDLVRWMRRRFAPDARPWTDVASAVARARAARPVP